MNTDDTFCLVYTSVSTDKILSEQVDNILQRSQKNNSKNEITGVLICNGGHYMQCLEGTKDNVINLFEKIKKDKRHSDVKTLFEGHTAERVFGDWSMTYKDIHSFKPYLQEEIEELIYQEEFSSQIEREESILGVLKKVRFDF